MSAHVGHDRINLFACVSRGIVKPHTAQVQCCGTVISTEGWPPGWYCEYEARLEEMHPFYACLERQAAQRGRAAVVEGASWL